MYRFLATLALLGTIAARAAPQTGPQSAAAENAAEESTGTRLGTEKLCRDVPANEKNPQNILRLR